MSGVLLLMVMAFQFFCRLPQGFAARRG